MGNTCLEHSIRSLVTGDQCYDRQGFCWQGCVGVEGYLLIYIKALQEQRWESFVGLQLQKRHTLYIDKAGTWDTPYHVIKLNKNGVGFKKNCKTILALNSFNISKTRKVKNLHSECLLICSSINTNRDFAAASGIPVLTVVMSSQGHSSLK